MTDDNRSNDDKRPDGQPGEGEPDVSPEGAAAPEAGEQGQAGQDQTGTPEPPKRGQIRYQDAETTTPREPTLGEQRARRRAMERDSEEHAAAVATAERKSRVRRRVMIGGGVTVGVAAMVSVWYAAATPNEVTANCVGSDDVIQANDQYCDENYVRANHGYVSGGLLFLPIPGGGYSQYHYNYGGTGVPGQRVAGGTTVKPDTNTTVKTRSGSTVQRGGFGVSGGGKSGGS
jgi:hypothetical protein